MRKAIYPVLAVEVHFWSAVASPSATPLWIIDEVATKLLGTTVIQSAVAAPAPHAGCPRGDPAFALPAHSKYFFQTTLSFGAYDVSIPVQVRWRGKWSSDEQGER